MTTTIGITCQFNQQEKYMFWASISIIIIFFFFYLSKAVFTPNMFHCIFLQILVCQRKFTTTTHNWFTADLISIFHNTLSCVDNSEASPISPNMLSFMYKGTMRPYLFCLSYLVCMTVQPYIFHLACLLSCIKCMQFLLQLLFIYLCPHFLHI